MFSLTDTIVAIATPPGRGGIGVVRLSGDAATRIACALLGRAEPLVPRHATFGRVQDGDAGRALDHVVTTWFEKPHSYTAEDVVEISAHGSPVILRRIVELSLNAGARLAEPGEFTLRAHVNGRLDLVQAEAVQDLVAAVTPLQARVAIDQLEGTLSDTIRAIESRLFDLCARLEASLDFPDEGFHFVTREDAIVELGSIADALERLLASGRGGRMVREGTLVVIAGRPNAGKSSLFNMLAGGDRAIVTEIPGTTRDLISETIDIGGLPLTMVDTAGLIETTDRVEAEGVRRARDARRVAALTLLVIDGSRESEDADRAMLSETESAPRLLVLNKSDLPRRWSAGELNGDESQIVETSAFTGAGLETLRRRIVDALTGRDEWRDPPSISNVRHIAAAERALIVIREVGRALAAGSSEELALAELAAARQALETIAGVRTAEDLLRHIFARFCVGK
jgi:tRNA modification GTPase